MFHIIISSFILSVIHASIPNHWLPIVAIGKAEKWNKEQTLLATALSGLAHITSTILIGIFIGWAGYKLSESYQWISSFVAPVILVGLGIIYVVRNFFSHEHRHHFFKRTSKNASFGAIIFSLSVGMFFSPCLELETYYFTAGTFGWTGILGVSLIYLIVTVSFMMLYVALAIEGINRFKFQFLERNENAVIGIVLILVGVATYWLNLH